MGSILVFLFFFFSSRRRHTRLQGDWSSDVCSSDLGRRGRGAAGGAGIAWSGDLFVTSAHVVTGSHATIVTPDGRAVPGEVVRRDAERDITVVRAAGTGVPAAVAGDPYALRPGALVFAVGHPFGVRDAVSVGVLQAVSPMPPRQ